MKTNFEKIMENITLEKFASMVVKAVVINGTDPFYVTTTGQLYPFNKNGWMVALDHEIKFLSAPCKDDKEDTYEKDQVKIPDV